MMKTTNGYLNHPIIRMFSKCSLPFLAMMFTMACATTSQSVNYGLLSVPEEGGIRFTKYTTDNEQVIGPRVGTNPVSGKLNWYAAPFIAVSNDGKKIAYVAHSNNFNNLMLKNIEGGKTTIQRTTNRNVFDMAFSPDNTKIAFSEAKNGNHDIRLINASQGAAIQSIADSEYDESGVTFSTSGEAVFFAKQEGYRFYIWSVNLETALQTQYSEGFTPVMTPDGKSLIVTRQSKDGYRGEIWMIDIERGTETLILNHPVMGFSSPDISPDGTTIVCVGSTEANETRPENLDIYTVKIDGTKLTQLTFHGGHDVSPQWAPDNQSIFFLSQRGNTPGDFNVWMMSSPALREIAPATPSLSPPPAAPVPTPPTPATPVSEPVPSAVPDQPAAVGPANDTPSTTSAPQPLLPENAATP